MEGILWKQHEAAVLMVWYKIQLHLVENIPSSMQWFRLRSDTWVLLFPVSGLMAFKIDARRCRWRESDCVNSQDVFHAFTVIKTVYSYSSIKKNQKPRGLAVEICFKARIGLWSLDVVGVVLCSKAIKSIQPATCRFGLFFPVSYFEANCIIWIILH